jgi:hypothetical protein
MCDYLVGGCGSSGSGFVNIPPYFVNIPPYKDPAENYWDISGIISNIPQTLPYTGGFELYKGVWGNPSRHHFRTLKAGSGIELSYDNPADDTNNSVVVTATGGTGLPDGGGANRGLIYDGGQGTWEIANYDNGLGIQLGATNLIQFVGGVVGVDSLQLTSSFNMSLTAENNGMYSFGGNDGGITLQVMSGNSSTHKLRVKVKDGGGVTLEGQSGESLISDGDGGVTWGPSGLTEFFLLNDVNTNQVPLADGMLTYVRSGEVYLTSEPTSGSIPQWDASTSEWVFATGSNNNDVLGWNTATDLWYPITISLANLPDVDNQGIQDGYVLSWNESQGYHEYVAQSSGITTASNGLGITGQDVSIVGGQYIETSTLGAYFVTSEIGIGSPVMGFLKGSDNIVITDSQTLISRDAAGYLSLSPTQPTQLVHYVENEDLSIRSESLSSNVEVYAQDGAVILNSVPGKVKINAPEMIGGILSPPGYGNETHILGSTASGEVRWDEKASILTGLNLITEGEYPDYVIGIDQSGTPVHVPATSISRGFTEISYRYTQGDTEATDLFIDGLEVVDILSLNIDTSQISINGGPFVTLAISQTIPAGANVVFKITYNLGFNSGVLAIKGGSL